MSGDIWQAMCHNAWQRPMHVGHMACHVSTCMAHGEGYKYGVGAIRRSREQQEGKGRKKKRRGKERKEREEKKRVREGEERERKRRRKGKRCSDSRNSSDQEVKSVYLTRATLQEVGILPILVSFYPFSYCFGLLLGPRYAMFMACFVDMTHFAVSIETGL